jgi:hypothetical protein
MEAFDRSTYRFVEHRTSAIEAQNRSHLGR